MLPDGIWLAETLFDQIADIGFFVKDPKGRYLAVNHALVRLARRRHKRELLGLTAAEAFPDGFGMGYARQDRHVIDGGAPLLDHLELYLDLDGAPRWCLSNKIALRDKHGAIVGVAGTFKQLQRPDESDRDYSRLSSFTQAINARFAEPLRIPTLAKTARMSADQLERIVRRVFQMTPEQVLIKRRIEHASQLLRETQLRIADIAADCGYRDQSAFARRFRATVGMTPEAFRKTAGR
jgi:AraC-like DNA-binding protein